MQIPDRDRPALRIEAEALRRLARLDGSVAARLDAGATPPDPAAGAGKGARLDAESLLLLDARRFTTGFGLIQALQRARTEARLMLLAGTGLAALTGTGLIAAAGLVTGSGVLNVYAVLVMLVGLNGVGMVAWLLGLAFGGRLPRATAPLAGEGSTLAPEGWLGRLGLTPAGLAARLAFLEAALGRTVQPWAGGALIHGFWVIALLTASVVLALRLAVEQVDFIWETTLLSAAHFQWLTLALGRWPAAIGFPVPDAAQVALTAGGVAATPDDPLAIAARRAWAGWLIGCTLVWGLLPRTLALAGCLLAWHRSDRRRRLPLSHPFWLHRLHRLQRLAPGGQVLAPPVAGGTAAPLPGGPPAAGAAALDGPAGLPAARDFAPGPGRVVAVELDDTFAWPPPLPPGWWVAEADPREAGSATAAPVPPGTRLVVVTSLARAPDRGLLRRLTDIARAWPGPVELALVEESRAIGRLGSREAVAARAADWATVAKAAGLADCWRLATPGTASAVASA